MKLVAKPVQEEIQIALIKYKSAVLYHGVAKPYPENQKNNCANIFIPVNLKQHSVSFMTSPGRIVSVLAARDLQTMYNNNRESSRQTCLGAITSS
jgi:hypothetical protein